MSTCGSGGVLHGCVTHLFADRLALLFSARRRFNEVPRDLATAVQAPTHIWKGCTACLSAPKTLCEPERSPPSTRDLASTGLFTPGRHPSVCGVQRLAHDVQTTVGKICTTSIWMNLRGLDDPAPPLWLLSSIVVLTKSSRHDEGVAVMDPTIDSKFWVRNVGASSLRLRSDNLTRRYRHLAETRL